MALQIWPQIADQAESAGPILFSWLRGDCQIAAEPQSCKPNSSARGTLSLVSVVALANSKSYGGQTARYTSLGTGSGPLPARTGTNAFVEY